MCAVPLPEVITTEENSLGGIALVTLPGFGPDTQPVRRGNFFDNSIDRGVVVNRFIHWFDVWGLPTQRVRGTETAFERSFFTLEWPKEEIQNAHGPQTVKVMMQHIDEFIDVMQVRRPRLVIFLSCYLWQAINHPDVQARIDPIFGAALDQGRRITDKRLAAWLQRREKCIFLALPQPSKNTTPEIVRSFSAGVQQALESVRKLPQSSRDPLLESAAEHLIIDVEMTVRQISAHLHVDAVRARKLLDALEGKSYSTDKHGRRKVIFHN